MRDSNPSGKPAEAHWLAPRRHPLSSATMLGSATVLAKIAALAKDWLVARELGAGDAFDAFLVALLIPSYAVVVMTHSFASAFVPTYVRVWQRQGIDAARQLTNRVLAAGMAALVVVALLLALASGSILPWVGIGFDAEKLALARSLFYPLAGVILASGLSAMLAAVLAAHERFAPVALAPVAIPAGTLVVFALFEGRFGVHALAAGTLVGFVVETCFLAAAAWRLGLLPIPGWGRPNRELLHVGAQYVPLCLSGLLMSSSLVVDQAMAASLGSGQVSVFHYGSKIVGVVLTAVAVSLSTALLPRFSRIIAAGDLAELKRTFRWYARWILLVSIPLIAVLAFISEPLVRLLFQRGAFTSETTAAVTGVQLCLLPQIPFYVLAMLGARLLSALDGNQLVLRIAALNLVVNVTGNYVLMQFFGVNGIAISTTVLYVVATAATLWAIRAKLAERSSAT